MLKILISTWNGYSNLHKKEQFLYSYNKSQQDAQFLKFIW